MIFSRKNAGKWVASKNGRVIDTSKRLDLLVKRIERRHDRKEIGFDKVPPPGFVGWRYGV